MPLVCVCIFYLIAEYLLLVIIGFDGRRLVAQPNQFAQWAAAAAPTTTTTTIDEPGWPWRSR